MLGPPKPRRLDEPLPNHSSLTRIRQRHGIRVAQHYDSTDCYVTPDKVVAEFLALLDRAY